MNERPIGQRTDTADRRERVRHDEDGAVPDTAQMVNDVYAPEGDCENENDNRGACRKERGFVRAKEEKQRESSRSRGAVDDRYPSGQSAFLEMSESEHQPGARAQKKQADCCYHWPIPHAEDEVGIRVVCGLRPAARGRPSRLFVRLLRPQSAWSVVRPLVVSWCSILPS
jgi:hypothetical protein